MNIKSYHKNVNPYTYGINTCMEFKLRIFCIFSYLKVKHFSFVTYLFTKQCLLRTLRANISLLLLFRKNINQNRITVWFMWNKLIQWWYLYFVAVCSIARSMRYEIAGRQNKFPGFDSNVLLKNCYRIQYFFDNTSVLTSEMCTISL